MPAQTGLAYNPVSSLTPSLTFDAASQFKIFDSGSNVMLQIDGTVAQTPGLYLTYPIFAQGHVINLDNAASITADGSGHIVMQAGGVGFQVVIGDSVDFNPGSAFPVNFHGTANVNLNDGSGVSGGTLNLDSGAINFDLFSNTSSDGTGRIHINGTSITLPVLQNSQPWYLDESFTCYLSADGSGNVTISSQTLTLFNTLVSTSTISLASELQFSGSRGSISSDGTHIQLNSPSSSGDALAFITEDSTAPANTVTPVSWLTINRNAQTYKIPLYQ